jgi:colanic acid/amylovoran biosynthesis glycosyltransferase
MKIAFVVDTFPLLSETFVLNQITGLVDRGHQVDIFSQRRSYDGIVQPDVKRYHLLERVHYLTVPSNKLLRLRTAITLFRKNFPKGPISVLRSLNVFKLGRLALSLTSFYTSVPFVEGYDIVHCHFGHVGIFGAHLKELGIRGKLVTTFHGYDIRLGLKKGGEIYHNLFEKGDCFIAISPYSHQNLINFGLSKNKIVPNPNGIDLRRFPYKWIGNSYKPNEGFVRVLSIARLVPEKGLQYAIKAIYKIITDYPETNVVYDIIGYGPLEAELNHLIQELMLSHVVHLIGLQDYDQIPKALRQSDIFLLPSIAEALPTVLMESQAVGLPVIATAVGSADQIVINEQSGFLIPPADVDAIAGKLKYLIDHPERWQEMGRVGRRHVEEHFDINQSIDRLLTVYQRLLDGEVIDV